MLGNIKFIGELGKLDLIHESILHKCIKTLLEKKKRVQLKDMGEDLECLCQIMRTVGPRLDHQKARSLMDQYFGRMRNLMTCQELPSRIRFLLQDTLELRDNNWKPRKAFTDNGPKTIIQIRQEAIKAQSPLFHNQSQQNGLSKDLTPRFSKKGPLSAEEVSLRPAQSFLLNKNQPKLQPQTPNMIPPSAQPPRTHTPPLGQPPQLGLKSSPPLIHEKPQKSVKKPPPSKEELLKMTETLVRAYLNGGELCEAVCAVKEMRAPRACVWELLAKMMLVSLEGSDADREGISTLIHTLHADGLVTAEHFMQAFLSVLECSAELEGSVPLLKSFLAQFAARAVIGGLLGVADLATPLEGGAHFPLFLLCLQQAARLKDQDWLTHTFQQSRVNMIAMLPEIDQSKERMLELLEGKGLGFLFPLLRLEKELLRRVREDPSATHVYRWVKDNVSPTLHTDKGFINILITSLLQYVCEELGAGVVAEEWDDGSLAPSRELQEQEKQLLLSFKPVMQKFLHEHTDLQVSALHALQVHCHTLGFPKGMLLRYFVNLYDMEIIEEEAFLAWKEDLAQEFPGKGKALFQVNQWLTWLETAEEEESEDDEE
ncbi:eukaryotic translation initiation factor 4 gamma 2-like isoform X3 [Alosa pseudoharengus]|uniref:eukaryotic translation initiation factor 4 gamma 2-like isoform X3 n=1 Tax=Alosa pseudoharengus TaxID=34774 RepID=UPI003F8A75E8